VGAEDIMCRKLRKIGLKWGSKNRGPRAPGRGVLQNSPPGYRNPVHILAIFAVFTKKRQT